MAVATVLSAMAGVGVLTRLSERDVDGGANVVGVAARPSDSVAAADASRSAAGVADFERDTLRVVAPEERTDVVDDGWIRVAARGGRTGRYIRAAVIADGRELGVATLQSDVRGVVEGQLGLFPIAETTTARLVLHEALNGYFLAETEFTLQPGPPVALLAPSTSSGFVSADRLWIFGATLPQIERVEIRVRLRDSRVVLHRTLPATPSALGLRAFSAEVSIPLERQPQLMWLDVSWAPARPESGPQSVRVALHVRSARDHHPTAHQRGPTPPQGSP